MPASDCSSSGAETVLGEEEDSPLSPCVWMHTAPGVVSAVNQQLERRSRTPGEPCTSQVSVAGLSLQAPRRELLLSPASQLNVLSQISELADVQSQQSAAQSAASRPIRQSQHTHAWAPASKREKNARPAAATRSTARKKQKTRKKPSARSQAERLAADMLDWETCSEGDLFEADAEDAQDDWVYEDISDSDFKA